MIDAINNKRSYQEVAIIGAFRSTLSNHEPNDLHLPRLVCNHIISLPKEKTASIALKANDGVSAASRAVNFVVVNFHTHGISSLDLKGVLTDINFQHYSKGDGRTLIEIILTYVNQEIEVGRQ